MGKLNTYISSNQAWTLKEQMFLKENYFKLPVTELVLKLNRSQGSIHAKASDMGLNLNSMKKTKPTGYVVRPNLPVAPTQAIKSAVVDTPNLVKKSRGKFWTKEEDKHLIDNYNKLSTEVLALYFGRTKKAVINRAEDLRNKGFDVPKKKRGIVDLPPVIAGVKLKDEKYVDFVQVSKLILPIEEKHQVSSYDFSHPVFATEQVLTVGIDSLTVKTLTLLTNYLDSVNIKYNIKSQKV